MNGSYPMTQEGYDQLKTELKHLTSIERPEVINAIAEARAHGDLSENAEYHAAKERQGYIEGRIQELNGKLSSANVIDVSKLSGDKIIFGATVKFVDVDTDDEKCFKIVGEDEADLEKNMISVNSPIARALIGKKEGDTLVIPIPKGTIEVEVLDVQFLD
ncbi:MAG: transcription elongation factor GreA [SAR324 cluster bacterium]|jgi:transcription elongation factor GreA|nr:transcription elongation factor GreA [Deltaproteobacteria bacterium]MDP6092456.1 transcription elongation factor GreA [SAR324 cluster bacterium]MBP43466.1 transcription elongation factor GreA [Deltaproteobacteria bacterium]MDP6248930.1 transcription elongation factor GreA [SAR324 cluster bacterium]MDP6331053.1 transcription elongation factor GreA [SAR324 cluster bacterium]|tara:strand:- start:1250 stop:1729 length:480 start_codon:yes stop_codon:yes gene_type:complete